MNPETFILRKKFLEEFYKEHVNFTFENDITRGKNEDYLDKVLTYESNVFCPETFNLGFLKRIIPFIFYLNSLYGCNLNDDIKILGFDTEIFFNDDDPRTRHTLSMLFLIEHNINYLSHLNQEVDKHKKLKICMVPFAPFNIRVKSFIAVKKNLNENIINSTKTFNSKECIICLTNLPQVLFCNCGHLCYCSECYKLKSLSACPICKTKNEIIRTLE